VKSRNLHQLLGSHGKTSQARGFTLIELLTVVSATAILSVLFVGAAQKTLGSASRVREVSAARQLVTALTASAQENDGAYLPGMDYRAGKSGTPVYKPEGGLVSGHAAHRYPYRLGPYLAGEFDGTIFVNRNKQEIIASAGGSGPMYDYQVSTFPALGMNIYCVGGVVRADNSIHNSEDCITRMASMKGSILAFASGGSGMGRSRRLGFSYVSPPTLQNESPICLKWQDPSAWTKQKDPMNYGWVDFRYNGKAVAAFLDGSVRMCSVEELSDMRLWSHTALEQDNPTYEMVP